MKPRRQLLASLTPNELNPRTLSDPRKAALITALAEFGDLSGFVFNRRSGKLIGGHQRRSVLPGKSEIVISERLAEPDALGTVARGLVHVGADRIPYREVDWPESKEKAAMLAANKHGGEFEDGKVVRLLQELSEQERAVSGFDDEEFAQLVAWVLISIPLVRFAEINTHVEAIAAVPGTMVETSASDQGAHAAAENDDDEEN